MGQAGPAAAGELHRASSGHCGDAGSARPDGVRAARSLLTCLFVTASEPRERLVWGLLAALAALRLVVYGLSTGPLSYGHMSDEFYYLDCAAHLAWGYVDHPPLSVALVGLVERMLGTSLPALRLLPVLAHVASMVVAAALARQLGGGRAAQALAALATIAAPVYLGLSSFYSMNAFEPLLWGSALWLLTRIANGARPSTWIWLGVVLGLAVLNKISALWLGLGVGVGLVATPQRRWLATPWPWLGGAVALALASPYAVWQAAHDWPLLEFMRNATQNKMVPKSVLRYASEQLLMLNPLVAPLWLAGLLSLLSAERLRDHRWLGWIWLSVFALLAALGSARANYLAPAYLPLLAAGGVAFERVARRPGWRWLPPTSAIVIAAGGALIAPYATPLLPPERFVAFQRAVGLTAPAEQQGPQSELPLHYTLRFGWPEMRRALRRGLATLTPEERAKAVVMGSWFGDTGMLNHYREANDSPRAISGHNNYWLWGPGEDSAEVLVAFSSDDARLRKYYARVEAVADVDCQWCHPDVERLRLWVCRDPIRPIQDWWAEMKHYQ